MLIFCPTCANVLLIEEGSGPSSLRFACQTCPYIYNVEKKVRNSTSMQVTPPLFSESVRAIYFAPFLPKSPSFYVSKIEWTFSVNFVTIMLHETMKILYFAVIVFSLPQSPSHILVSQRIWTPPPQIWTRGPIRGGSKSSLQLLCRAGIEITLARSPMATGFCFGRAENLENLILVFCPNGERGIDPNLYFKKVSCLLLVEVVFWFCCDIWGKWYVNRRSSFGMKC